MNNKNKILLSIISVLVFSFVSYFIISNFLTFRFVLENRTNIYLNANEEEIINLKKGEEIEELMYCENIVENETGLECGFYISGISFSFGRD